eukprot:CAMPEP_0197031056 /NCGR_PEP_ID=MMETSP1384-20130603/10165_1 /TAXON_ID=29189 /ORGANISM="Ammonia sp." /LENGTH=254 /DNA_ID=CAMNT_0042460531 /DNA_START=17 /DNA_END=781 /DNA_ORIENTATION=-
MQTSGSRRRRTSASLKNDEYDPKEKSNDNQTLYIILAVIGAFIFVFILYKVFSSSEPSTVSQTNINEQQYYEEAYAADDMDTNNDVDNIDELERRGGNAFHRNDPFGFKKNKLFGNPFKDREGLAGKLRRERGPDFDRDFEPDRFARDDIRGRMPPRYDGRKGEFESMRDKLNKVGNLESYKNMMRQKRPFSEFGEGPIFNELNRKDGADKLSPEQVKAAREKFHAMGGLPFGGRRFEGREGRAQQVRQRREEM